MRKVNQEHTVVEVVPDRITEKFDSLLEEAKIDAIY